MNILDLPPDLLRLTLENIARETMRVNISKPKTAIKTLVAIESTSKKLHTLINDGIWKLAWTIYAEKYKCEPVDTNNPKACLLLYTMTGCQFCKIPRIRKVYEQFQVRCCTECLYKHTISDYKLDSLYLIKKEMVQDLPSISKDMWSKYAGEYTLTFYWISQIEKKLGCTLDEYSSNERKRVEKENLIKRRAMQEQVELEKTRILDQVMEMTTKPEYHQLDAAFIETFLSTYNITFGMTAQKVISDALHDFQNKELDKYCKNNTRKNHVTIVKVRKTQAYKAALKNGNVELVPQQWLDIREETFADSIKTDYKQYTKYSALYKKLRETFTCATKQDCETIEKEIKAYIMSLDINHILDIRSPLKVCNYCSIVFKNHHALLSHTISVHIKGEECKRVGILLEMRKNHTIMDNLSGTYI